MVIVTGGSRERAIEVSAVCRKLNIAFFYAQSHGLFGAFFLDLGKTFEYAAEKKADKDAVCSTPYRYRPVSCEDARFEHVCVKAGSWVLRRAGKPAGHNHTGATRLCRVLGRGFGLSQRGQSTREQGACPRPPCPQRRGVLCAEGPAALLRLVVKICGAPLPPHPVLIGHAASLTPY